MEGVKRNVWGDTVGEERGVTLCSGDYFCVELVTDDCWQNAQGSRGPDYSSGHCVDLDRFM
jgi:hypothetical protein